MTAAFTLIFAIVFLAAPAVSSAANVAMCESYAAQEVELNDQMVNACGWSRRSFQYYRQFCHDHNYTPVEAARNISQNKNSLKVCREKARNKGGDEGGGETGRRIVRTDTDVYNAREGEKIGTLRAGQSVKTAGACGNDWCQLSNGTWFWGGDLR